MLSRNDGVLARRVEGVKGLTRRLNDAQKAEVAAGVSQILGRPPQGVNDRDLVLWLQIGNIPPFCRGADEVIAGVRTALVFVERFQRAEFDNVCAEDLGRVNPFHEVAKVLRAWLPDPEKTKPDGGTSGSDGSV
jgi:hypothetical protein